jgi:signal transduction histidine kinase
MMAIRAHQVAAVLLWWRRVPVVTRVVLQQAVAGVGVLLLVGVAATALSVHLLRQEAVGRVEADGTTIATRTVAPLVNEGVYRGSRTALTALDDRVRLRRSGTTLRRINLFSADGVLLYSDDRRLIGERRPLGAADGRVLATGGVDHRPATLCRSAGLLERFAGDSLEVNVGAKDAAGHPILIETYYAPDDLLADEAGLLRRVVPVLLGAMLAFLLGVLLVPQGIVLTRRIARHERERPAILRLAAEASSTERRRVAAELNDGVIPDLTGVAYGLTALDAEIAGLGAGTGARPGRLERLRAALQVLQRRVHENVLALREMTGLQYAADTGAAEPAAALRALAHGHLVQGVRVEVAVEEPPPLPAAHRAALARVGREALRNAAQHAPGSAVRVSLRARRRTVVLEVADDGPGFDPRTAPGAAAGRYGLTLLTEAAVSVRGRLVVRSRPGRGTTVRLTIPLR